MKQESEKSRKIREISLADYLVKLVFSDVTFNRLVNRKIIERIKVIAGYDCALFFKRKIIFL